MKHNWTLKVQTWCQQYSWPSGLQEFQEKARDLEEETEKKVPSEKAALVEKAEAALCAARAQAEEDAKKKNEDLDEEEADRVDKQNRDEEEARSAKEQTIHRADEDKVNLQQYVTRIYGSLTTFNVLFKYKEDQFKGASKTGGE